MRMEDWMGRQRFTPEQIIAKLRVVEVLVGRGATAVEACRQIGNVEQKLYRWRKEYGGLKVDQGRRIKDLERGNARLKKLEEDLMLDRTKESRVGKECVSTFRYRGVED